MKDIYLLKIVVMAMCQQRKQLKVMTLFDTSLHVNDILIQV
jgi:hypothetical protein